VGPGKEVAHALGLPELAGVFTFSLVGFVLAWLVVDRLLRPDPLLTARRLDAEARVADTPSRPVDASEAPGAAAGATADPAAASVADVPNHDGSMRRGLAVVRANPRALLGMLVMALGHLVMVSVMVMTPIHMKHGHAELEVIGFVISVHILGMYALSPLVGMAVDRWGSQWVATVGGAVLMVAAVLASWTQAGWSGLLLAALFLLGVGWSCTLVSGSTLLTSAVSTDERPATQGLADVVMGLAGAVGGVAAGVVVGSLGYGALASGSAVVGVVVLVLGAVAVARSTRRPGPAVPA
jgi:Na+/melibiose symporter-like transporter